MYIFLFFFIFSFFFFSFYDTATTDFYTLSLHDALPIYFHKFIVKQRFKAAVRYVVRTALIELHRDFGLGDRKSTRLNSSHVAISYAVFCLKKKKQKQNLYLRYKNLIIL